jgi:hypothetical protein
VQPGRQEVSTPFFRLYKEISFSLRLDTKFADRTFGDNSAVFLLSEPLVLPSDVYDGTSRSRTPPSPCRIG